MFENSDLLPDDKPRIAPPTGDAFSWRRVITQLRHAPVRDLAFLLLSPPLLHPGHPRWQGSVQEFTEDELRVWRRWLLVQDMAPMALQRFLAQESSEAGAGNWRLGRYAEQLLAFALMNAPPELKLHLIARNIPLRALGSKQTTGELDFVVERHGVVEHWEMAVKFYLSIGNKSLDDFVSPSAFSLHSDSFNKQLMPMSMDTLGNKLAHMIDRQLALDALLKVSEEPGFALPSPIAVSRAYLRGWLFYPAFAKGLSASSVPQDWGLHPQHPHGIWIKDDEAATLNPGTWLELPRLAWLSPARMVRNADRQYPAVTLTHTESGHASAPSLWAQLKKRDDRTRQELQRVFVVPGSGYRQ